MNSSKIYNIPAEESESLATNHINGSKEEILARMCITELCKGWPVYRDASEWKNFRSLFTREGAYVWTTWSGALGIDDFIVASIAGRTRGDFIMHRENGTLANVNISEQRGIGKMKATITQRLVSSGYQYDVECDCRLIFFVLIEDGEWKTKYMKLFYEKDKVVSIDGMHAPTFDAAELDKFTDGYKYLAAAQHSLGHKVLENLPNANNKGWRKMYDSMTDWLQGKDVNLFWEK